MQVYLLNFPSGKLPVSISPWLNLRNAYFFCSITIGGCCFSYPASQAKTYIVAFIISLPDYYCSLSAGLKIPSPNVATDILSLICHWYLYPANLQLTTPPPWKNLGCTGSCRGSQCIKGLNGTLSSCRLSTRNAGKCSKYTNVLAL